MSYSISDCHNLFEEKYRFIGVKEYNKNQAKTTIYLIWP